MGKKRPRKRQRQHKHDGMKFTNSSYGISQADISCSQDQKYGQEDGVFHGKQLFSHPSYAPFTPTVSDVSRRRFGDMYEQPDGHSKPRLYRSTYSTCPPFVSPPTDGIVQKESSFIGRSKEDIVGKQKEIFKEVNAERPLQRKMESENVVDHIRYENKKSGSRSENVAATLHMGAVKQSKCWRRDGPEVDQKCGDERAEGYYDLKEKPLSSTQRSSSDDIVQMKSLFTKQSTEDVTKEQEEILEETEVEALSQVQTENDNINVFSMDFVNHIKDENESSSSKISSSSEFDTPLMKTQERKNGSGFTPNNNEEVPGLELGEKNVATGETIISSDQVAELGSLLTCSICLEMLTDSRTLGCLHSFCNCCLEKYVKRQRKEASAKSAQEKFEKSAEEFECPNCRSPFILKQGQGVEAISPNHLVNSLVDILQRRVKEIPSKLRESQEKKKVGDAYCKIHEEKN